MAIAREVHDPGVGFVTLTRVKVSPDLQLARVYYTMLGDLVNIVVSEKGNKVFKKPMFPRATWFPELVQSAEVTRNIFAHMNPLQKKDIRRLGDALSDWLVCGAASTSVSARLAT